MPPSSLWKWFLQQLRPIRHHTPDGPTSARLARVQSEAKLAATERALERLREDPEDRGGHRTNHKQPAE